ncbi:MAG TPA: hypothetical protein PLU44_08665 [Candidatus Krumholzibacteria bacterium]|nr:hypothetical protein [Candidatus Krumholzibacteria bacterium]HRY40896.1 hypothetical protein [Candidatus Krumholzibacteria bacterium]
MAALWLGTLGFVAGSLPGEVRAADESWAAVTVVFTSDIKGQIEPCG